MGPVFPKSCSPQIFKPFFRVEESRDTNSGGIGLGLSIAMRAVQVHQGTITAENAKPGLKVQIVLPRLPSTEKVAMQTPDADRWISPSPSRSFPVLRRSSALNLSG